MFLLDGAVLSGGSEQAAFRSLLDRFGPVTLALLKEISDRYERQAAGHHRHDSG